MKLKILILLLFILQQGWSQRTISQLNQKIRNLPSDQKIDVSNLKRDKILKIGTFNASSFSLPAKISSSKVLKYDNYITQPSRSEARSYNAKLASSFKINNFRVIPEYYLEVPVNGVDPLIFKPIITDWKPLVYEQGQGYKATISFILYCENDNTGQSIKNPVNLEVTSSRLESNPRRITIGHVNLPSTDIEVFTESVNDSVDVRIITNSNAPKGYTYYLKVNPVLKIKTNRTSIQGLGIQETSFEVMFNGSSSSDEEQITITSSKGKVEPASFLLAYNETKTVHIRSEGLNDIRLTASTTSSRIPIEDSNTVVIKQNFPWLFLGFALVGGLLGVLIKFGFEKSKKYKKKMIAGILIGLLSALAYYVLGINFLKLEISATFNEFAVLTFSALSSIFLKPNMLEKRQD